MAVVRYLWENMTDSHGTLDNLHNMSENIWLQPINPPISETQIEIKVMILERRSKPQLILYW